MKRNLPLDLDANLDLFDDFGDFTTTETEKNPKEKVTPIHSDNWTIVEALNTINELLPGCQLKNDFYIRCAEAFDFLTQKLQFNPVQCVIIAMLIEKGKPISYRQMGKTLGLSRLSMMTYYNDIEELFKARWLTHRGAQEEDGMYEGYGLAKGVISAIRKNQVFVPEVLKCKDTHEFVEKLSTHIDVGYNDNNAIFSDEKFWIMELINANKNLPICKEALKLKDIDTISFLMLLISDYCNFHDSDSGEGVSFHEVKLAYHNNETSNIRLINKQLQNGTHELFKRNLIEHKCEDGIANCTIYVATAHLKDDILEGFTPADNFKKDSPKINGLKSNKDITPKTLFYNKKEDEQIKRIQTLLSQEQLPIVQERLKEKGMRTGVCILMHGAPGTGKTATAYEIARQTGRDIIQVQVTDFKDKFVGESEAKLKNIFNNYRFYCQNCELAPILLFNEGDAILSKRTTNIERSVDQMSNALQNILLEEMENLEGIMIVTTNLTTNLDSAFERRFIFKVQFDKPDKENKARIWKSMIEELSDDDSLELAESYDVSGGEIENIARKSIMEYVISGQKPNIKTVKLLAETEKLKTNSRPIVGFNPTNR